MSKSTPNFLDRCRIVLDVSQQVCVKEVHASGCFYIQLLETDDAYKLDEMHSRLEREKGRRPSKKYIPRLGEIVLSNSLSLGSLCRSEVVSLQNSAVRVFHVDYGSYETLPQSRVAPLPNHALQPTRQAIKCCLSNATCLTSDGLDTLRALSVDKELEGKLQWSYDSICYYMILTQPNGKGSIGELLIAQGMATPLVRHISLEPGLESVCHMATVVSPSEMYFHFASDQHKLHDLQEMMNSTRLTPFKSMAPLSEKLTREGAYCLIQNPADMHKYRARVTCVRPSEQTAQVHLVDFGHTINVTFEHMFIMTPDTAEQPALCFTCSLTLRPSHSHSWGPAARERLLSLGEKHGMRFEVCVKNRIGIVHWVHVYTPGSSQPLEDSLSDLCVTETNYYLSMYRSPYGLTLDVDEGETVCITHVVDWNKFFVQLTKHSRELDWLTERLAESFSDTELDEQWLRSPTEGVLCAAPYYEANTWARAVVTSVPHCAADKVQVFYIDYGNRDEVLPYDLKIIPTFAMHHPAMAIECGLYSSKQIGAYNLEEFRALVSQKALYMTVQDNTGEHYSVSLVDKLAGGINILESLELRSLSPISPPIQRSICSSPGISPVAIPMRSLPLNNKIQVLCTFADSPSEFRCQLLSHTDTNLSELTRTLQLIARETAARLNTRDIRLGMPIMALNTMDQLWYRAVVLEKEQRSFIVDLVDYGNRIKIQTHEMTHLPIQLISLPAFGIVCKIHLDVPHKWSEEECEMFKNIILGTKFRAVPRSIERRVYGIDILEQDLLIKLRYIGIDRKKYKNTNNLKHLLKPLKLDIGSRNRLSISYFENPGHFFCQLEDNAASFNQLQENLAQISTQSQEHINFNEGEYCLSLFADDDHFYRAKIVTIDYVQGSAEVFYVDYGRSDMVYLKNLRNIPEEFTQLSIQAIHCSLWGVHPIGTLDGGWHSESRSVVNNFLADTDKLLVDVREIEKDKCHVSTVKVEVLEPAGLAELLVTEGFAFATYQSVDIPTYTATQGTSLQVEVTYLAPDHIIYLIPVAHGPKIDQIISGLKTCYSNAPLFNAKVGQCVAARSADSGIWNRARVLSKVGKQEYEVLFIDIGAKEIVEMSSLRHIPSFATHTSCKTFRSILSHTDEYVSSPNYVQVFRGIVGVGTLLCEVDKVDKDELHSISLKLPGGENVIDELINQGALSKIARKKTDTIYPTPLSIPAQPGDSALPLSYRKINLLDLHMSISLPSTSDVVVSHLDNPSNFYIQFATSHSQLQFLGEQINQHYSCLSDIEDTNITPTSIVHGAVCCTRFAQDNLWYRGKVLEVTQNEVVIQYVDYGNREIKSTSEIKLMHPNFYALPAQAIRCSLVGVAPKQDDWSVEASQLFQSLTFNKLLQCTFISTQENGMFYVSLVDPQTNINVAQVLINSRYAKPVAVAQDKKKINEIDIKSKSQENVYMSDVSNPDNFHLHLSSLETNLNQFMDQITSYYGALKPAELAIKSPVVGNMCCCRYMDNNWYRAVIKEVKDSNVNVYFVDYGNLYTVPQSDCKQLNETFYQFPKHSIECCLHDVALASNYPDWAPAAISFFKRQTEKQQLVAKFIQKNSEGRWEVTLTQGTRDIGKLICEAGMAISKSFAARYVPQAPLTGSLPPGLTPTQKESPTDLQSPKYPTPNQGSQYGSRSPKKVSPIILPRGHKCEAYVSYAVSPNDFSVQLTEFSEKLDAMMDELARHCERSYNEQLPQPQLQMFVAAKFTEDDKWYRAIILNTDTPGIVKVHYIDYGNRENLDMGRIKALPAQLYSLQAQSVKCSLRGFSKDTRFSTELMDKFRQTVTDRYFSLNILQFQNTYYEVDLIDDTIKQSMASLFHVKSSGPAQVFIGELKPLILSTGTDLTAQLCVINSPNDFYMQVAETSEALNSMEFELNRTIVASKALKSFELKVGVPCAACFSTTGTWYRAKVLAVSSPKIHVLYVDYGNDEWLLNEKIQPLPQKFLSLPCQAFRCALRPHQKRYTDEDVDKFKNKLTAARDIRVKIVGHNDQYIYLVELFSQQTNEPLKFTSSQPVLYSPLTLPAGVIDRFKVCHILPSGLFYLQRENAEILLNTISSELTTYASRIQLGMRAEVLLSGSPCAVKYSQDDQWYRGKVIRIPQQGQVEVQFVDYGNDDSLSLQTLLPMPETILSHPTQAILAMLQSNHEQGTKPSIKDLEEFQSKTHEIIVKVTVISKNQEVHVVKMFLSNDEEITMSGMKPPGYRKGHPGEEVSANNGFESKDKYARHGEYKQRGDEERGYGGRSGRSEGGYGNRERNEGGSGGRDRSEGGYGGRDRSEGGSGGKDRSEGGFGGKERSEGGYGGRDRSEGGSGGKDRSEGGFGGKERSEGGFGSRERNEGGYGGRDRSEGGYGGKERSEGGYGGKERGEGGYGGKERGEGGYGGKERSEGGYGGKERSEGGYGGKERSEGGYGGRSGRNEGGYGNRERKERGFADKSDRSEGGFGGREKKEGGFGEKDRSEGGFGEKDRSEGGFGEKDRSEGGFGNRDKGEGGFGRSDRGRDRNEGGSGGRSERGEGGYRSREDRSEGKYGGRSGSRPDTGGFGNKSETWERSDKDRGYSKSSDGRSEGRNFGDKRERNYGEKKERDDWNRSSRDDKGDRNAWGGSEDIRLKSDVLGTQGWAKNAESKEETVHWDTKPELKSTDTFTEERLVINQAYEVYVSYIVSAKEFYCSLTHKSDRLEVVMKNLETMSAANSLTEVEASAVQPDKAVVTVFSDDKAWYRAKILAPPQAGFVQVQFVDYGNSEKVPVANLKTLPCELLELPSQAIPCMLPQEVEKFRENIETHEYVKIKVTNVDGEKTTVDVFTTDGKIIYKMKPSPVGKKMDVYTSHVISPYEFYCQSTNTNTLDRIVILLSELTNTNELEEQELQPGQMCLGVFSEDSSLYRGIIIQVIDIKSKILVQFMDYGNSEMIHPSKISQMPSNISSFPTQAYKCAVVHPTYKISQEKIDQFVEKLNKQEQVIIDIKEAILNQYLLVDILNTSGKPIPLPFTVPTSTSIAEPPTYPIGAGVKCGISHITNPTNFYCQSVSITETLDKLMDSIDNDVTNNQLSKLKSIEDGTQCVAQYSGDSGWYRGVIVRCVDAHNYIVQYIDYGNSEKVEKKNMYSPKPEYLAIPPCAFQCGVVVTEPVSGWSDATISEFSDRVKALTVILEIVESNMDNYKVRMLDEFGIEEISLPEFGNKTTKVELRCEQVSVPEKPVNVYISFIKSVDLFYLQLSEREEGLSTLMEKVHTECTSGSGSVPIEWSVGMICLTKFIDDGAWYRSRIEQISEGEVTVNYFDYGNSQTVSKTDVLSINDNLLQKPFAMPCRFTAGYGIQTTAEVEAKFEEYMPEQLVLNVVSKGSDGVFECQLITQVDSTDDPVDIGKELADLLSEETRINRILSYCERTATELTRNALAQTLSILTQHQPCYFQRNPFAINSNQNVYLTHVDDQQGLFYVQLSDSDAAIQELMGLIAQYCAEPVNIVKPDSLQIGSPCLTKFVEDDTWYRAEVHETFLEFDHVKVLFIDYGNSQTAHIDSIVKISPDLLKTPVFGYVCKFTDSYLIPKGFGLSSTLSAYEMESLLNLEIIQTESYLHCVKLSTEEGQDLGQVISDLVPVEVKHALFSEQQDKLVNKLIDRLLQDVVTQLETENKHNETSALLDGYANEYVECILLTSQSKLELEEETAIDKLVNDVINVSTNHVTRIHEGFKALPLPTDLRISVNLSHIVSTQCFYVQVLSQAVELFQLTEEVETYCSDPAHTTPLNGVETELPVLAVFSQDSTWYRGMVTAHSETRDRFNVRFVDFGNSDEVPESLISHLPDHLLSKASFSYQCKLSDEYNLKPDVTTITKFTELTEMKTDIMMEVVDFKEGVYEVRLFDGTEGEVGILMNTLPFFYPEPNDPPHPVTLTCYNSQDSFYLQTNSNQNTLQDLQTQMVEYCASSPADTPVKMEQLLPGILVLVYFEESQSWSRAKILANSEFNRECQIQLIDYGPVLMAATSQIRLVSPRSPITMLPPIAFHCKLPAHYCVIDCIPVNEEFVRVRPLTATFNGPLPPNNQFEAEVFDTDKRLAITLEKVCAPSRKWNYVFPQVDKIKNVFVSAVDTVLKFHVQESGSEDVIANLMAKVSDICKATKPVVQLTNEDLYEGMAVLAVFSEDGEWYRGQVLEVADTVRVCFVDYGNVDSVTVSSIRHVPYELLCVAPLAYPCKFNSEIGLVTCPEVEESFQALTGDVELSMKVLTAATEHVEVELSTSADPDKNIGKSLFFEIPKDVRAKLLGNDTKESIFGEQADLHTPTESIYKLTLPPINSSLKGITTNIISIQDFYIQDNELTSELVSLTQLTPASNELVLVSDISIDDMVLAKFSGDDEIYRARVISTAVETINVFFIDYGNSDCVPRTSVYQIPSQQKSYPCFAMPCCLHCDLPVTEVTSEKLTEAVEDKDLEVVIKDHKDNRLMVELFLLDNGDNVLEMLEESLNNEKPESDQDTIKTVKTESDRSPKKLSKAIDTPILSNHPDLPSDVPSFPELDLEKEDGEKFEATVTHSNNLSSFYLHKKHSEDQINELMDKLLSHCGDTSDNTPPPSILPGMAVIAMLDGDGSWYRGQIVEQQGDSYSVFSVDYGNIETISSDQILPIASEFLQEPLAYPCKLYLANDTPLPETAFDTFSSLLEDTSCQVDVMSVEENMLEVKIEVKEGDVFTLLFKS